MLSLFSMLLIFVIKVVVVYLCCLLVLQISQQLDVVHKLERDLNQSARSYEELKQRSDEEVSETPDENANFS